MSTNTVSGMIYPTQKGMLAGNPRDSAIAQMNNTNTKQSSLVNAVGGKKIKCKSKSKKRQKHYFSSRKKKGGSTIAVPQFTMLYTPQSGTGTDPNSQIKINSQVSTQGAANAVYDQEATKTGGYRRFKRGRSYKGGNNPDWHWGCSSGGKRKSRKTKKR
jgi:hypothetical protein